MIASSWAAGNGLPDTNISASCLHNIKSLQDLLFCEKKEMEVKVLPFLSEKYFIKDVLTLFYLQVMKT